MGLELESRDLTERFAKACCDNGLILGWTLHSNTVIRLAPPLIISDNEIRQGMSIMGKVLQKEAIRGGN